MFYPKWFTLQLGWGSAVLAHLTLIVATSQNELFPQEDAHMLKQNTQLYFLVDGGQTAIDR